jgi:hypothetical protein
VTSRSLLQPVFALLWALPPLLLLYGMFRAALWLTNKRDMRGTLALENSMAPVTLEDIDGTIRSIFFQELFTWETAVSR